MMDEPAAPGERLAIGTLVGQSMDQERAEQLGGVTLEVRIDRGLERRLGLGTKLQRDQFATWMVLFLKPIAQYRVRCGVVGRRGDRTFEGFVAWLGHRRS